MASSGIFDPGLFTCARRRPHVSCRAGCWRHLYGAFTVWLDVHPEQSEEDAPQRGAYSEAEVILRLKMEDTVNESRETVVENVVAQVLLCSSIHL
jgi:hypothetical protein